MPTTIPGLLLSLVLLLPGFTYVVIKERFGVERKVQPYRETINVFAVSIFCDAAVLLASWPVWARHLDVDRLLQKPQDYFHDRPGLLAAWALALLAAATVLGWLAALPRVRRLPPLRWVVGPHLHPSTVSAWWRLFEEFKDDRHDLHVGLFMEDGRYFQGRLVSFNNAADDLPDRDLILGPPLIHRAPGALEHEQMDVGAMAVSARRILAVSVAYVDATSVPRQTGSAAEPTAGPAASAEQTT